MMRRKSAQIVATALVGAVVLGIPAPLLAQKASTSGGSASRPRSTDERVGAETATPPPVNSDYRRAAEGTLPAVPGGILPSTGPASDPASRPVFGSRGIATAGNALPPGMDAAILIGHSVEMTIEASLLSSFAEANKPDEPGNDAVKMLMTHAQDELRESKELLSNAASAGGAIDANSPIRKFYGAATNYATTLASLSSPGTSASPNDKAQLALINHSVKGVMDANRINMMAGGSPTSGGAGQLLNHARMMKDEGTKTLDRMVGSNPPDPSAPPSPVILAQRGKELLDAANQIAPMMAGGGQFGMPGGAANGGLNGTVNGQGPNPGRLQDTRPEIVGGTYGTGSQTAGTATGGEAAKNVPATPTGSGSSTSGYGVGNNNTPPTQSTAGPRPR